MHYVKHFQINGVDTKQIACIELQGAPNAATEGAVGVLGMDMTSPTHDVYRCVAVNGSVYTWELLSAGMSIINATITGEGALEMSFPYSNLRIPKNYMLKVGDLIIDSEGYLYHVNMLGIDSCDTTYCGTHIGGIASGDKDYRLILDGGQLKLVTESGAVLSSVDYLLPDESTLRRDANTGKARVMGVITINGALLKFYYGNINQYNALSDAQKRNLIALVDGKVYQAHIADALTVGEIDTIEVEEGGTYIPALESGRIYMMAFNLGGNYTEWYSVPMFIPEGATEVRSASCGFNQYYLEITTADNEWLIRCRDVNYGAHDVTVKIRKI